MKSFKVATKITRFPTSLAAGATTLVGAYLASAKNPLLFPLMLGAAIVTVIICASCFVLNDYFDVECDAVNQPNRPIPSGQISKINAGKLALLLTTLGLCIALYLGWSIFLFGAGIVLLNVSYSRRFKNSVLLGNLVVAGMAALSIWLGAVSAKDSNIKVFLASVIIFSLILAREILKTVPDIKGDRAVVISTIATRFGHATTIRIFQFFVIVAGILTVLLPIHLKVATNTYIFLASALILTPTLGIAVLLRFNSSAMTIQFILKATRYLFFLCLFTLIFLR